MNVLRRPYGLVGDPLSIPSVCPRQETRVRVIRELRLILLKYEAVQDPIPGDVGRSDLCVPEKLKVEGPTQAIMKGS